MNPFKRIAAWWRSGPSRRFILDLNAALHLKKRGFFHEHEYDAVYWRIMGKYARRDSSPPFGIKKPSPSPAPPPRGQRGYQPQSAEPLDPMKLTPPKGGSAVQPPDRR